MPEKLINSLLGELEKQKGEVPDLSKNHYYLFFEDAVFDIYFDEEEQSIKAEVIFSENINVFQAEGTISKLIEGLSVDYFFKTTFKMFKMHFHNLVFTK